MIRCLQCIHLYWIALKYYKHWPKTLKQDNTVFVYHFCLEVQQFSDSKWPNYDREKPKMGKSNVVLQKQRVPYHKGSLSNKMQLTTLPPCQKVEQMADVRRLKHKTNHHDLNSNAIPLEQGGIWFLHIPNSPLSQSGRWSHRWLEDCPWSRSCRKQSAATEGKAPGKHP